MKHRFLVLLILLIVFNIGLAFQLSFIREEEKEKIVEVIEISDSTLERKIFEEIHPYQLRVYYPVTDYSLLNQKIEEKIQAYIKEFKNEIRNLDIQLNQEYTLDILYEEYSYENYISYVFTIFQDTGGAHPNTFYDSISYDIETGKVVTLESLIQDNPDFLKRVSNEVRKQLSTNHRITSYDMFIQGTYPVKDNFKVFAFTEEGLLFFFSPYTIAPYSSGRFQILIPYSVLKN